MTNFASKGSNLISGLGFSRSFGAYLNRGAIKGVLFAATLTGLAVCAQAQSSAASSGWISYSFQLDPASSGLSQFLTVDNTTSDNGLETYNIIDHGLYPYGSSTGTGFYSTNVDPSTYYDGTSWSGYNGASDSSGESGAFGTASASVGIQENLELTNSGTDPILIDISATAAAFGSASVTGATTASNFASVNTYSAIYDFNLTTLTGVSNPFVHLSGTAATGISTAYSSDWTPFQLNGLTYYSGSYVLTLAPGETHALEFYTSGSTITGAGSNVPSPAAAVSMLVGLAGLVRRRRKAA